MIGMSVRIVIIRELKTIVGALVANIIIPDILEILGVRYFSNFFCGSN
ncbi:MAG: large-conductance mechanosensitive channel [Crocinitomicaceae bacterium]|jgi:large-conductance mechanosensitive channel